MPYANRATIMMGAALALAVAGCSAPGADPPARSAAVAAPYPPPAKRAEIPPSPPAPDLLWLNGHWSWNGVRYIWTPGYYAQRPSPTANWLPGYWVRDDDGWLWTEGHWES